MNLCSRWNLAGPSILLQTNQGDLHEWRLVGDRFQLSRQWPNSGPSIESSAVLCHAIDGNRLYRVRGNGTIEEADQTLALWTSPHSLICTAAAATSKDHSVIFVIGTSTGTLIAVTIQDNLIISTANHETGSPIVEISLALDGIRFAAVCRDRTIRTFALLQAGRSIRPLLRHYDAVERFAWQSCGFSADGEQVYALVAGRGRHLVYLWDAAASAANLKTIDDESNNNNNNNSSSNKDTTTATLIRILDDGPKASNLVLARWNPHRPVLVTLGETGQGFVWRPRYPQKWAALVPGLEAIEANVIYEEREDEFDNLVAVEKPMENDDDDDDDLCLFETTEEEEQKYRLMRREQTLFQSLGMIKRKLKE